MFGTEYRLKKSLLVPIMLHGCEILLADTRQSPGIGDQQPQDFAANILHTA